MSAARAMHSALSYSRKGTGGGRRRQIRLRGGRRAHVVSSTNRVVTGSVHSFLWLLDDLAGARESWRVTIAGMNALAARRASDRRAHVEPHLQAAERYGVSGL